MARYCPHVMHMQRMGPVVADASYPPRSVSVRRELNIHAVDGLRAICIVGLQHERLLFAKCEGAVVLKVVVPQTGGVSVRALCPDLA